MRQASYLKGVMLLTGLAVLVSLISVSGEFGWWLSVGLLAVAGVMLLYSLISQINCALVKPAHRLYAKDFSLKLLATLMGFFLIFGTLLYFYVFYTIGHDADLRRELQHSVQFSNAEYLFRSLICSLDLFMLDVDSNILDRLDRHAVLKGWLAVQAVLSFACTIAMLVGLVYSRLRAYYRLNYATRINDNKNHLYLFFGNNAPSELLIADIAKNDPKAVTVIIDVANIKDDDSDEWQGIVGLITHKQKVFNTAEKTGAHVTIASRQLDDIEKEITSRDDFDAFGYLGLSRIKQLIGRLSRTSEPQLHIFFMDEDEELNIRNIITLAKDTTILSVVKNKDLKHRIYCHARYNGPNRVIEDVALKKHLDIRIVDSSHIAVELLKLDPDAHPVNAVEVCKDNPATVEQPLKALIVGFGEVGRDAFRFLYEFGAFVSSGNPDVRSPFECVIVDKKLNDIQGTFMSMMPGIFMQDGDRPENESIRFENIDYGSREFYSNVLLKEGFLESVNYIVISIGNNDEAIALAARIFTRIRKVREDVSNLRIFVRCTDNNKVEGIQKIADHYNFGYGEGEKNVPVIRIFGQPEKTYTYDLVVNDRLIEEAKRFHEEYNRLAGGGSSWDERHRELTETGTPDIEKLRKLRRQESQDRANVLHAATKLIFFKRAMSRLHDASCGGIDLYSFCLRYFNPDGSANVEGSKTGIRYPELTDRENEIILRLAQLEHLRWIAAHELAGYVFNEEGDRCDERTMMHNCLCPWSRLDRQSEMVEGWECDYKKFDFCVVDTTIALNQDSIIYHRNDD